MEKNKKDTTVVLRGGGDDPTVVRVPKGKKIQTPNGFFIAGETIEENIRRHEDKVKKAIDIGQKANKAYEKNLKKSQRVDFMTGFLLHTMGLKRTLHQEVFKPNTKMDMEVSDVNKNEVYIFNSYDEYRKFFLMYLDDIEDELIDSAIYTKTKSGKIIALKGLCEHIIIKKKVDAFYRSFTEDKIEQIHAEGKITPLEMVFECEELDLCAPGEEIDSVSYRCRFFDEDCHECLCEFFSHKEMYDEAELELMDIEEPDHVQKHTRNV